MSSRTQEIKPSVFGDSLNPKFPTSEEMFPHFPPTLLLIHPSMKWTRTSKNSPPPPANLLSSPSSRISRWTCFLWVFCPGSNSPRSVITPPLSLYPGNPRKSKLQCHSPLAAAGVFEVLKAWPVKCEIAHAPAVIFMEPLIGFLYGNNWVKLASNVFPWLSRICTG